MDAPQLPALPDEPMRIVVSGPTSGVTRVAVAGEVDLATGRALGLQMMTSLDRFHPAAIDLDVAEVSFLDCYGIGVLVTVSNAAQRMGCQFWISHPQPMVARILTVLGLLGPFTAPHLHAGTPSNQANSVGTSQPRRARSIQRCASLGRPPAHR